MTEESGSFGDWVRQRRRALDITQAELARRVGCATITIRKIERDQRRPSSQIAELLAQHLAIAEAEQEVFLRWARGDLVGAPRSSYRPPRQPAFLAVPDEEITREERLFVGRKAELAQLDSWLQEAVNGNGRIGFVTGEAGRGKTSLLNAFAEHAQEQETSLIVASGICNAFSGAGDPYLPFRHALSMLIGDVEARWTSGAISREHAVRLWQLAPFTLRTLLGEGQVLIDTLIPAVTLARIAAAHQGSPTNWREDLDQIKQELAQRRDLEQRQLFEQFHETLARVAARRPLLLLLDDLQWADGATIDLLFHLSRRLPESRMLVIGAYRPSEVALSRTEDNSGDSRSHSLERVIHEIRRRYGEIELNLGRFVPAAGQAFVDALLDSEPNRLDAAFRRALFGRTKGHPLFTVELLRALQEQGDVTKDENGRWWAKSSLAWDALPVRVEAVIAQRIGRLSDDLRRLLATASVEGELFTAQVVAEAMQMEEQSLLQALSRELEIRHRLVRERDEVEAGDHFLTRYQFRHALFQQYLYNSLSSGERRLMHREIARALESLYGQQQEEVIFELAYHYRRAGERQKGLDYTQKAARRAATTFAFDEAIEYVNAALALIRPGEQRETRLALLEQLADLHVLLGQRPQAVAIYQEAIDLWAGEDSMALVGLHRKVGAAIVHMTWFADRQKYRALARRHLEAGLKLVQDQPPHVEAIRLLTTLADEAWFVRVTPDWDRAEEYANAAVEMAEALDAPVELSASLNILEAVYSAHGKFRERLELALRRLELSRDPRFNDLREQANILVETGKALTYVGEYGQAMTHLREAEEISERNQVLDLLYQALRYQAVCYFRQDDWDAVLAMDTRWRGLARQYPNFEERAGPTCFFIALVAAVHALRGIVGEAHRLREESVAVMVANDGPADGWGRDNHY